MERGFACMVELLLKLRYCRPVIAEVPMVLRYDRKQTPSKLKLARTIAQYLKLALRDRLSPPPVRDAEHGEDGPLHGAVALALDHVTTAAGLADWAELQRV